MSLHSLNFPFNHGKCRHPNKQKIIQTNSLKIFHINSGVRHNGGFIYEWGLPIHSLGYLHLAYINKVTKFFA